MKQLKTKLLPTKTPKNNFNEYCGIVDTTNLNLN